MLSRSLSVLLLTVAVLGTASSLQTPAPSKPDAAPRVDHHGDPLPPGVLARCGSSRLRHGDRPEVLLFTPDKKHILTGSSGCHRAGTGRILLWEVATGKLVRQLSMEWGKVMTGVLSADGRQVECASTNDEQIECCRFELATGRRLRRQRFALPPSTRVLTLALRPDNTLWAAADCIEQFEALQFDVETGKVRSRFAFKANRSQQALTFSGDGQWLGVADGNQSLRVFSLATGQLHKTLREPVATQGFWNASALTCAFSPDGRWLARTGNFSDPHAHLATEFELWDVSTGTRHLHWKRSASDGEYRPAFTPDSRSLLINPGGPSRLQDVASGKVVREVPITSETEAFAFSADGQLLAASTSTGIVSLWDTASGKKLPTVAEAEPYRGWLYGITVRHGRVCMDEPPPGRAWDPATGRPKPWVAPAPEPEVQLPEGTLDAGWVNHSHVKRFSADRQWVAFRRGSDGLHVWNLQTGQEALHEQVAFPFWSSMDLSPNARWLAATPSGHPQQTEVGQVFLWNVTQRKIVHQLSHQGHAVPWIAFSPDSRMLATSSTDTTLRLWETATGQQRHVFTGHQYRVDSLVFTPDGRLLAAASADAPIFVWEVHGHRVQPLTAAELEPAWLDLHSKDASLAFKAIQRLAATPKLAVPFLTARLQPVSALPAAADPDLLRCLRAVEALEWIGTPDVLPVLDRLAGGAPDAMLTKETKASAQRLRKKATP